MTVRVAFAVLPWYPAVMVTLVCEVTALVVMLKVADVTLPAGTVTVAGTVATVVLELDNESVIPPLGAGAFKVTVFPTTVLPPSTPDCVRFTEEGDGGATVRMASAATPL